MRSIAPSTLRGVVAAPPSKSVLQRAIAAATLASGTSEIRAGSLCDDARAALGAATVLGAAVSRRDGQLAITGGGTPSAARIDCGESGLCLRMFAPVAALGDADLQLVAHGSLAQRPVAMLEGPLRELGATCSTASGLPPVTLRGPLQGGRAAVDGRISSQLLTGLLIALPLAPRDSELEVIGLQSKPYVRLTVELLSRFGAIIEHDAELRRFRIPGGQRLTPGRLTVEGDWSGAAFLLVAGATAGRVAVRGIDPASAQADRRILVALERAGARLEQRADRVAVAAGDLVGFAFDATDCPDLFPPLAALAAGCRGATTITGVGRLRSKESDRAAALCSVLGRLGVHIGVDGDRMSITGGPVAGGRVAAHGDHRIAMAAAVVGLGAADPVEITGAECVAKSYPQFFDDLESLGARVS